MGWLSNGNHPKKFKKNRVQSVFLKNYIDFRTISLYNDKVLKSQT